MGPSPFHPTFCWYFQKYVFSSATGAHSFSKFHLKTLSIPFEGCLRVKPSLSPGELDARIQSRAWNLRQHSVRNCRLVKGKYGFPSKSVTMTDQAGIGYYHWKAPWKNHSPRHLAIQHEIKSRWPDDVYAQTIIIITTIIIIIIVGKPSL